MARSRDPATPATRRVYGNGLGKFAAVAVLAIATGLGSSYITVLTATPSRTEVREMVGQAIAAVKEIEGLDRETLLQWRDMQSADFAGLRNDVQALQGQQARTNALLEILIQGKMPGPTP